MEHTANNKNYDNVISAGSNQNVSQSSQEILRKAESWGKQYNISAKESLSILSNSGLGIYTPIFKMGSERQKATGVSQDELLNSAKTIQSGNRIFKKLSGTRQPGAKRKRE